jgi:hypothetical protein
MLVFAAMPLFGCSILGDDVERGFEQRQSLTSATFTTADIRIITSRNRPNSNSPIICTEPTPDVAKALSTAAQVSAQGGNAGTTGGFGAGGSSAEAALALAGRSTALLGLRDGLYRACEAYANGAIGADAYALILSRYGQLMTTLFLGQDITGAAGTVAGASVQSPPVSVTINPSGGSTATTGQTTSPTPAASQPAGNQPTSTAENSSVAPLALTRMNEDYLNLGYNLDALVIACVNYGDASRVSPTTNKYLDKICSTIFSGRLEIFSELARAAGMLVKNQVLAPPVDPAARVVQSAQKLPPVKGAAPPKSTR